MKRYIIQINEQPIHPSKYFEQFWLDSKYWLTSIFNDNTLTFNQWKLHQITLYEAKCECYEYNDFYLMIVPENHHWITDKNIIEIIY